MSAELGATGGLAFVNENSVYQKVLAAFPLCDMTEEDLRQNPQFCKLLTSLAHHVDKTGLLGPLKTELEKAEQKLLSQRRVWLQSESLNRALQEMIWEHKVRKHHAAVPPDQSTFYETVEKCLLVAQCARRLDPSDTTKKDQPSVLGLTPQQVMELMPSENNVERMKQMLPAALEERLKKKCLHFLSYYQPEWENQSESLKRSKVSHLSAQLAKNKQKAEDLKESSREKSVLLQRQTQLYLSEMTKCVQLLQSFILENRLKIQADLDRNKLDYFEGKCKLVSQKIKAEMVAIRLETYTADSISAHKEIRKSLESELRACQAEKQSVESKLSSFEILGKEFEALAEDYGKLRQEIEIKNWALKEFTKYNDL
ncbi:HAUS augmin-like complex subunit 4 isoform X1 [Phyllopteryx taeniolatus]|uniref:HAUS augmin-like complex subunit 4 isoform X1 n=1 Tax=Phyllopteryx taeniolatus TaxID=161469 RepID=UPI002AD404C8|nr:HAUS augmin-like complex subunit 4 isoform X1 [Phyllopteryx taeniolatus]